MNFDKACLFIPSDTQGTKNYPFTAGPEGDGFKNLLFPFVGLRNELANYGIDLSTKDINSPEESFLTFCWDNPHLLTLKKKDGQIWCLLINDPPVYYPESWDPKQHERFDYVFTYDETLVDNKKYFYYPIAQDTEFFRLPDIVTEERFQARRLATNVSNAIHKYQDPNYPNCTHFRRYETIKWYGKNHPEDFRFYGGTFRSRDYYFAFRGVRHVRKIVPPRAFSSVARFAQKDLIRVFGGELTPLGKFDVIKNFNFYYCYENTTGINGYLTEKMFDCLYSGVVPIYWGAPNVGELVPYNCYLPGGEFGSEEELYHFIKEMDYSTYLEYLLHARAFLSSDAIERFTVQNFTRCLLAPLPRLSTYTN